MTSDAGDAVPASGMCQRPGRIGAFAWTVWETFRQARASAVHGLMTAAGVLGVLSSFTISITPGTEIRLWFGWITMPWTGDMVSAVAHMQWLLAVWLADTVGILLALIWTASFLPNFLEPSSVTVMLVKPVTRWNLLAGKYLGIVAFVGLHFVGFVVGTWLALGLSTGVWNGRYLLAGPLLTLHFAIFFSFSSLLAVTTRRAGACIVGVVLFWLMCWGMNVGRHALGMVLASHPDLGRGLVGTLDMGYWLLPKPADQGFFLSIVLEGEQSHPFRSELEAIRVRGELKLGWSVASSVLFSVVMLGLSAYEFEDADY